LISLVQGCRRACAVSHYAECSRDVVDAPLAGCGVHRSAKGKARLGRQCGQTTPRTEGTGASRCGLPVIAVRMAPARDDRVSVRRASRLGEALAQEPAGARGKIRAVNREHAMLRPRVAAGNAR
jgi:hypothetical protein